MFSASSIISFGLLAAFTLAAPQPAALARHFESFQAIVKDLQGFKNISDTYTAFLPTVSEYDYSVFDSTMGAVRLCTFITKHDSLFNGDEG